MIEKDLLIMQTIAEFRKYKELEENKSKQEKQRDDDNMASYHKGRADGITLMLERLDIINNLKK
jgi:hypothetical protein